MLVYHAGFFSRANEGETGLSPFLARLNVGVAIFFVISGFLLYRPFVAARCGLAPAVRVRDYARRRALRIIPAYWVALTALAIYPGLPGVFSGRWWVYYGFGQDYSRSTILGGIGPAWSLGCEVVFYALLPLLSVGLGALASRTSRGWWKLELAGLGVLTLASVGWRAYGDSHPSIPSPTFASTFGWFAAGMALAVISVVHRTQPARWLSALARYSWAGWILAAVAYGVICRGLDLGGGFVFLQRVTTAQDLAVYVLSGLVALGLALPAVFEPARGAVITRFLTARIVAWLGLVSYAIYLYHYPIAKALNGGITSGGDATVRFLWLAPATAAIAIAAAALSYYLVERPVLRFKEARARRPARVLKASD